MEFKKQLELATKFYNNINKLSDNGEEKSKIIERYSTPGAKKDKFISNIMSSPDNFEIYHSSFTPITIPPILIVKYEIMNKYTECEGFIYYFTDNKTDNMISPIILVSSRIFEYGNPLLLEYIIMHEVGHYRLKHVSGARSILDEVEADLSACDSMGVDKFIAGVQSFIKYVEEYKLYKNIDMDELMSRFKFVTNIKGVKI